jgi:hypothetical protein
MPDRTRRNPTRIIRRALPYLIERIADPAIPDARLTPLERTVRAWRLEVLADLGGDAASAARCALLDATVGTKLILSSLDAYLFHLATAEDQGMVNRRGRFAFRIVHDRMRVADSFTRQLQALGLDRVERPPVDLTAYLAGRQADPGPPPEAAPEGA